MKLTECKQFISSTLIGRLNLEHVVEGCLIFLTLCHQLLLLLFSFTTILIIIMLKIYSGWMTITSFIFYFWHRCLILLNRYQTFFFSSNICSEVHNNSVPELESGFLQFGTLSEKPSPQHLLQVWWIS